MRQVAITIGGKIYRLQCRPGEEDRVRELAGGLDARVSLLMADAGAPLSDRMLVMASLLLMDELSDLEAQVKTDAKAADPRRRSA